MSQNLNDIIGSIGGEITSETMISVASSLPSDYVLTLTIAAEVDVVANIAGIEAAYTTVFSPNGTVHHILTGGDVLGTSSAIANLPVEFVGELGIAYIGDEGIEALEGASITVEQGFLVGYGATFPWDGGLDYLEDLMVAASSGDVDTVLNALSSAPEGTVVFVSSGIQAGGGLEGSVSLLLNSRPIQTEFGDSAYWDGFNTAMDRRVAINVVWQVDYGNGGSVTIANMADQIEEFEFADGSVFTSDELVFL